MKGCGRSPVGGAAAGGAGALELVIWATSAGAQPDGWTQGRNLRGGAVGQAWQDVGEVLPWIDAKAFCGFDDTGDSGDAGTGLPAADVEPMPGRASGRTEF